MYGEEELQNRLRAGMGCYPHIISIGDPGSAVPEEVAFAASELLVLRFLDLDGPPQDHDPVRERLPDRSDIQKVVQFFDKVGTSEGITVHCWQGLARSASIALCLLYRYYGDVEKAAEELLKVRPFAKPNRRILELFDQEYQTGLAEVGRRIQQQSVTRMVKNYQDPTPQELEPLDDGAEDPADALLDPFRWVYALAAQRMRRDSSWFEVRGGWKGHLRPDGLPPEIRKVEGRRILALGRSDYYDEFMAQFTRRTGQPIYQSDYMVWLNPRDPYASLTYYLETTEEIHFSLRGVVTEDVRRAWDHGGRAASRRDLGTTFMTVWELNQVLWSGSLDRTRWYPESEAHGAALRAALGPRFDTLNQQPGEPT